MNHIYTQESFLPDFFTYPELYKRIVELFPSGSHFVEVGTFRGRSTAFLAVEIANSGKAIRFDTIDSWKNSDYENWNYGTGDFNFEHTKKNLEPLKEFVTIYRANSHEKAADYPDKSLDFVFIDGDHSYEGVRRDIEAFLPKMKDGSIMAGHDHGWHEPIQLAVKDVFGTHNDWGDGFTYRSGCFWVRIRWKGDTPEFEKV